MVQLETVHNRIIDNGGRFEPTLTYASSTTATISGDWTSIIKRGHKIELTQSSAKKYGYITNVSYSAPNTTLTIPVMNDAAGASASIANSAISGVYIGSSPIMRAHPHYINYTPTLTPGGSMTTTSVVVQVARFACTNVWCKLDVRVNFTTGGTANSDISVTFPFSIDGATNANTIAGGGRGDLNGSLALVFADNGGTTSFTARIFDQRVWTLGASRFIIGRPEYRYAN